jgi:hypothetical protein
MAASKRRREAQERARKALEAKRRAEAKRKRLLIAWTAVGVVVVLVAVLVVVRLAGGGKPAPAAAPVPSGSAAAAIVAKVTGVPASALDQVGTGPATTLPSVLKGQSKQLEANKPLVLYIGAEYCPFCAAQRWPVVIALSRFGTFEGLSVTASAADDSYPNTPTLSFHGSRYTSEYLSFQGVETTTNKRQGGDYTQLDKLTDQQRQLMAKYNAEPYVPAKSVGSIPFIDYANQALSVGAAYDPQLLSGMTAERVAAAVQDPNGEVARTILGSANAITAVLCTLTGNQPGNVCTSPAVRAYAGKFNGS